MGKSSKGIKKGDLVVLRTPPYHKRLLGDDLEGKSGVVLGIYESDLPGRSLTGLDTIFEILIEGRVQKFYNFERYLCKD